MNTANPQLEGLYLAIANINRLLVAKGILSRSELSEVLQEAERQALSDPKSESVSESHKKAMAFPIRLLQLANDTSDESADLRFEDLARAVGRQT